MKKSKCNSTNFDNNKVEELLGRHQKFGSTVAPATSADEKETPATYLDLLPSLAEMKTTARACVRTCYQKNISEGRFTPLKVDKMQK